MRKIDRNNENPIDDVLIEICEYISEYVHAIGLTPNMITTLSLIFGVTTSILLYKRMYLVASTCWIISYFFDCLDGHIARKYNQTSKFGDYYDHISDTIKTSAVLFALYSIDPVKFYKMIIIIAIFGFFMCVHLGCQEKEYAKDESDTLSFTQQLCPNTAYALQITKYFGCGTFNFVIVLGFLYYSMYEKRESKSKYKN